MLGVCFGFVWCVCGCLASSAFIEQRRRDLKRFMVLVVRHPVLVRDDVVNFFLTASGQVSLGWTESSCEMCAKYKIYNNVILSFLTFSILGH